MTPERWREVSGIVDAALDLPAAERAAFVARACASDEARRDVERYLDACVRSTSFLSEDVGAYAGALIGRRDRHARYEEASVLERFAVALAPRYRIERELGRGGMAIVYLAHDVRHGRRVAVKVLRPELAAALGAERFLREIETAARLTHPHILPLLDSGAAHGQLYYVMPYVEGESLRERLRREGQLPLEDARRIARELASALDYAHRHNVLHRDLKPENVLLADGQAVVTDFGIARAISRAAASTEDGSAPATLTATGLSLGTPAYMSPEQAAGSRELDARSDVYALGCVLYEMLAGQPPFTGPTVESVVRQHLLMPARTVSVVRQDVPPAIAAAVSRALAKDVADRFATMQEFAGALTTDDVPRVDQGDAVPWRVRWRRHRAVVPALALSVALVGAAVILWDPANGGQKTDDGAQVSPMRVTVFPFAVHAAPEWRYLGEATMDVLGSAIHGVGELRRVAPHALLNRMRATGVVWQDGIAPDIARGVSEELGAGRYILGSATVVGGRVHLSAFLYVLSEADPVATATGVRSVAELPTLVTELARMLFAAQAVGAGGRMSNIAAMHIADPVAARAYYEGEAMMRRGEYDQAATALTRAVEADSTFALAWYRLSVALDLSSSPRLMMRSIDAALRHAHRLSPSDRRLVEANHAFIHGDGDLAEARALAATNADPDNAEAWGLLGAVRWWHGWQRGELNGAARDALERALELDDAHPQTLHGLTIVSLRERRYAEVDSLLRLAYPIGGSFVHLERDLPVMAASAFGRADRNAQSTILERLETAGDYAVQAAAAMVASYTDDLAGARTIALLLEAEETRSTDSAQGPLSLALVDAAAGRLVQADAAFAEATSRVSGLSVFYRAWLSVMPDWPRSDAERQEIRAQLLGWTPSLDAFGRSAWLNVSRELRPHVKDYLIGLTFAQEGQADSASRYARILEAARAPADSAQVLRDLALEIRALDLAARGDTTASLQTLERSGLHIRHHYQTGILDRRYLGRYLRAELLFALHRNSEALGWYQSLADFPAPGFVFLAPAFFRMGELHERLGNRAEAIEHYERFVRRWQYADPDLRPRVDTARARIARLRT